jgi:aryl sulfotransferase
MDSARWEDFDFRPDDIVISTPPKSGTTWMQMICALLVFQTPRFDKSLDLISPWLDMLTRDLDSVTADLAAQDHRRFIKTHTPLDGLPWDDRVTYVCVGRDPRDVGLSWDNHFANMNFPALLEARQAAVGLQGIAEFLAKGPPVPPDSEAERFWGWVDDPTPPSESINTLHGTVHHLATFWEARHRPNVTLLRYEDLKADLEGQMRRLADALGILVAEEHWPALVEAATFEQMRSRANEVVPDSTHAIWKDNRQFFNRGECGQWRRLLDASGVARYRTRIEKLADPDLATWVHASAALYMPGGRV